MSARDKTAQVAVLNRLILRSIVDHAVVALDAEGNITSWNEGAQRVLGWSEDEIVGKSADIFFTEDDERRSRLETEMRMAVENGRAEDVRWHTKKGGERFWGSGLMMPLLAETDAEGDAVQEPGEITGYVKIFRDRTAEREAELRIARLRDRARLAMNRSGTVGVFEAEVANGLVIADSTCAGLHQVEAAEDGVSIRKFLNGIVEEDREAIRTKMDASIETGADLDLTYRVVSEGSKPIWVQAQGSLHTAHDGAPARYIGIVTDITDQHEELRMQEARLEFVDRLRDMKSEAEIARLASRVIGETLHASRVGHGYVAEDGDTIVVEADWTAGDGESIVGTHRFSDFGSFAPDLQAGRAAIIDDIEADPRITRADRLRAINVRSAANLPLLEDGKLKATLFVNDAMPRTWTDAEIDFMRSMVDRTYAAMDRLKLAQERDLLTEELATG